jgi:hypothetical protein
VYVGEGIGSGSVHYVATALLGSWEQSVCTISIIVSKEVLGGALLVYGALRLKCAVRRRRRTGRRR